MDRKGWIMLILCGIGMMFTWKWSQRNTQEEAALIEKNRLEYAAKKNKEAGKTPKTPAVKPGELAKSEVVDARPAEQTHVLTSVNEDGEVVKYTFTNRGGGIKSAYLIDESDSAEGKVILNQYGAYPIGALATDEQDIEPLIYPEVTATENSISYSRETKGLKITKTWTLEKEKSSAAYRLNLVVQFNNSSDESVKLRKFSMTSGVVAPLFQDERADLCKWFYFQDGEFEDGHSGPFEGGMMSDAKDAEIVSVSSVEYFGVTNQFYNTIIQPAESGKGIWVTSDKIELAKTSEGEKRRVYTVGANLPDKTLPKGGVQSFEFDIYTGPRKQSDIVKLGKHTEDVMGYSWFSFAAPWANSALNWIHDVIAEKMHKGWSWGIAIVILTICIRILIWPLHNKSTRTMKRMSKLQPIMKEIREEHKDNPQKVQQETLKLYKKYKVNPMGGCLPMLLQMPIFFAVFGMLTNAVELRGEGFLWVSDLSRQENLFTIPFINIPFNILPITMALTMVFQMRMTPSTGDKLQRRIFMLMPIMFFFFCYSYASALALYWTVQNIVSIIQTWLAKRLPEPELVEAEVDPNKPRKKGFMEKMTEKLEEAQNQREAAMAAKTGRPAPKAKKPQNQQVVEVEAKEKKRTPRTGGK